MTAEAIITHRMEDPATQVFSADGQEILRLGMTDNTRGWMNIVNLYPALGVAYVEYGSRGMVGAIHALMKIVWTTGKRQNAFDLRGLEPVQQLEKLASMHNFTNIEDMILHFGGEEPNS